MNIAGQDQSVLLELDPLANHGLSGPAEEDIRRIAQALENLVAGKTAPNQALLAAAERIASALDTLQNPESRQT